MRTKICSQLSSNASELWLYIRAIQNSVPQANRPNNTNMSDSKTKLDNKTKELQRCLNNHRSSALDKISAIEAYFDALKEYFSSCEDSRGWLHGIVNYGTNKPIIKDTINNIRRTETDPNATEQGYVLEKISSLEKITQLLEISMDGSIAFRKS